MLDFQSPAIINATYKKTQTPSNQTYLPTAFGKVLEQDCRVVLLKALLRLSSSLSRLGQQGVENATPARRKGEAGLLI